MNAASIAGAAALFGGAGAAGAAASRVLCRSLTPSADGPRSGTPPAAALVCGTALLGATLALRNLDVLSLAVAVVVSTALVASWCSDVRYGVIPDAFTLAPLAIVLGAFAWAREFSPFVSAVVVFLPFAIAAALTQGFGMGWGDVKLVALGGAVLGLPVSLLAFAAACLVAFAVAIARHRRSEPIAFAPYLAGSIAAGLLVPSLPSFR